MLYMSFGLFINYIGLLVEGPPLEVRTCAAHLINLPLVALMGGMAVKAN